MILKMIVPSIVGKKDNAVGRWEDLTDDLSLKRINDWRKHIPAMHLLPRIDMSAVESRKIIFYIRQIILSEHTCDVSAVAFVAQNSPSR